MTPDAQNLAQQIVSFYSGHPANVAFSDRRFGGLPFGGAILGEAQDGNVIVSPQAENSYLRLFGGLRGSGGYGNFVHGLQGLTTLIHEAIHARSALGPGSAAAGGFQDYGDERQAQSLGMALIPDALQRFFGIPFNSPLGQRYYGALQQYEKAQGF